MNSIQRKISITSMNSNDHKFTKVIFERNDQGI